MLVLPPVDLSFILFSRESSRKLKIRVGTRAYADREWLTQSAARLGQDGARLDALLRKAGFELLGGAPLFRLARHAETAKIFERLGAGGVLTRPFAAKPDWLRFGIPHRDEDFVRLAKILISA